jgi:NarL family two-component system response regulator LiaR
MSKIRILIVDDHAIVRTGLAALLGSIPDFEIVGEASNGSIAVSKAIKLNPDVIVMDLVMPKMGGVEATTEILSKLPDTRILILTSFGTSEELSRVFSAGATGAILKNTANSALVSSIRRIAKGNRVVSPEIENMLANEPPIPELSSRQRDILESLTRGLTNNEIAMQFDISPESVKTHIAKLFEKIGAGNRSEAVSIALRKHLLKL